MPGAVQILARDPTLRAQLERELSPPPAAAIVTCDLDEVGALRLAHPQATLVVVGIQRSEIRAALDAGADAALAGPLRAAELRSQLRAIARRRTPAVVVGIVELDCAAGVVRIEGAACALPASELALLHSLVSAGGAVVSKAELACCCWGHDRPDPAGRALERRMSRLRRRLGRHAFLVVTVWGVGYRLAQPDSHSTGDGTVAPRRRAVQRLQTH